MRQYIMEVDLCNSGKIADIADITIEGLDSEKGVKQSGGRIDDYYETLAVYYDDGMDRKSKLQSSLDGGDLSLYTTHVHALKGASASIGAYEISETALTLEMAGIRGDLQFISENNALFISKLERLLINIDAALSLRDAASAINCEVMAPGQFKKMLLSLVMAVDEMDVRQIDEILEVLVKIQCTPDVKNTIKEVSRHILMSEFDEASELVKSLLKDESDA